MTETRDMLTELQERGYFPSDMLGSFGQEWFDLGYMGNGMVRVLRDDTEWHVSLMTANQVNLWTVKHSDNTPLVVILATMDAAESIAEDM